MSEEQNQAAPTSAWRSMARSLAHRNYRLFFVGAVAFAMRLPYLRPLVRPICTRMGILPEVAAGVQSATYLTQPPAN